MEAGGRWGYVCGGRRLGSTFGGYEGDGVSIRVGGGVRGGVGYLCRGYMGVHGGVCGGYVGGGSWMMKGGRHAQLFFFDFFKISETGCVQEKVERVERRKKLS